MLSGRSIPLVRVFGIRIGVDPSWFLALFLFGFGYVGAGSLWQGALGQGIRRIPAQIRQFATRSRVTPLGLGSDAE